MDSIMSTLNVCLNVLMTLPIVWNELSNNMWDCFGLDYLLG